MASEPATPLTSIKNKKDRTELDRLCRERRDVSDAKANLEIEEKRLNAEIQDLAERLNLSKVRGENWLLLRSRGGGKETIVAEKLLEKGVPLKTIKACTEVSDTYEYYQVRAAKTEEE